MRIIRESTNMTLCLSIKGIVSVYIVKFSNGSWKGIPNKQSSALVSHLVTSSSGEYSIATKHTQ